jgi:hypothetical protein
VAPPTATDPFLVRVSHQAERGKEFGVAAPSGQIVNKTLILPEARNFLAVRTVSDQLAKPFQIHWLAGLAGRPGSKQSCRRGHTDSGQIEAAFRLLSELTKLSIEIRRTRKRRNATIEGAIVS